MARVKRGFKLRRRHKKVLAMAKGYRGARSAQYRTAVRMVRRGLCYAFRDRRVKKREFRSLWIQRINAAVRAEGLTYGRFMYALSGLQIALDRKQLSELAIQDAPAFVSLAQKARNFLSSSL